MRAQQRAQLGQHPVTGGMALEIIDVLEVVDVHQGHAGLPRLAIGAAHRVLQGGGHRAPVRQAGQRVGAALFGQVGVLRQQHVVVLGQQALVIVALHHVALNIPREAAQLHYQHDLAGQRGQCLGLAGIQVLGLRIEHAQRAQWLTIPADQWRTGIEAHMRIAGDQWVVVETDVLLRILHHHDLSRFQDCVPAHRIVTRQLDRQGSVDRFEPLPFNIDQSDSGHAGATHGLGDDHQVIEGFFALRVQDVVAAQRFQALGLINRLVGLDHAASLSGRSLPSLADDAARQPSAGSA